MRKTSRCDTQTRREAPVKISRRVVVFDARDIDAQSKFWAGLLSGEVHPDEDWYSIVVDGEWVMEGAVAVVTSRMIR